MSHISNTKEITSLQILIIYLKNIYLIIKNGLDLSHDDIYN